MSGRGFGKGIGILLRVGILAAIGIYAATQNSAWPSEVWVCIGAWVVLGVLTLLAAFKRR